MVERKNGRKDDELRPVEIVAGVIPNANGSAMVKTGKTTVIAAVYGPKLMHPKHMQIHDRASLNVYYAMVPFSTKERVRPGPSRRSTEICKVMRQALEPVVMTEEFPKAGIDIFVDIIQANAGTRTAAINAASVALADAGIPMKDLVASTASGMIDGVPVMDLEGKEEDVTACDLPIAYMPRTKKVTLLQMDGDIAPADLMKVLELTIKGCEQIYKLQKEALKKRWIK